MAYLLSRCLILTWFTQVSIFALTVASLGVDELAGTRCVPVVTDNCTIKALSQDGRWYLLPSVVLQGILVIVPCVLICWRRCGSSSCRERKGLPLRERAARFRDDDDVAVNNDAMEYGQRVTYSIGGGRGGRIVAVTSAPKPSTPLKPESIIVI